MVLTLTGKVERVKAKLKASLEEARRGARRGRRVTSEKRNPLCCFSGCDCLMSGGFAGHEWCEDLCRPIQTCLERPGELPGMRSELQGHVLQTPHLRDF